MNTSPAIVLLVDDDKAIRETTADLLSLSGYNVITAASGQQAIAILDKERVDVVLSDIIMPNGNGYELLAHVRAKDELSNLPLVLLSAKADKSDIRKGMVQGADDYLTKPFQADELLECLQRQLLKRHARLKQLLGMKEQIARSVPHELRSSLSGILGYADLLSELVQEPPEQLQKRVSQSCAVLRSSGLRIQRLVERVEAWLEMETHPERIVADGTEDPAIGWSEAAHDIFQDFAKNSGRVSDLTANIAEAPLAVPSRFLLIAISALAENAFRYSPSGSPVKVDGAIISGHYQLSLRTTRKNWHAENLEAAQALAPFEGDSRSQQGLGLGLAIALRLCELIGTAPEVKGDGTTVEAVFRLPLAKLPESRS